LNQVHNKVEIKVETGDKYEGRDVDNDEEKRFEIEVQSGLKGSEIYVEIEVEKEVEKEVVNEVVNEKEVEDEVEQGERIMVPLALQAIFSCLPSMSSMDIIQGILLIIYIYTYMYVYIYIYMHICIYICMYICIQAMSSKYVIDGYHSRYI
jgi:hypothetical protein